MNGQDAAYHVAARAVRETRAAEAIEREGDIRAQIILDQRDDHPPLSVTYQWPDYEVELRLRRCARYALTCAALYHYTARRRLQ